MFSFSCCPCSPPPPTEEGIVVNADGLIGNVGDKEAAMNGAPPPSSIVGVAEKVAANNSDSAGRPAAVLVEGGSEEGELVRKEAEQRAKPTVPVEPAAEEPEPVPVAVTPAAENAPTPTPAAAPVEDKEAKARAFLKRFHGKWKVDTSISDPISIMLNADGMGMVKKKIASTFLDKQVQDLKFQETTMTMTITQDTPMGMKDTGPCIMGGAAGPTFDGGTATMEVMEDKDGLVWRTSLNSSERCFRTADRVLTKDDTIVELKYTLPSKNVTLVRRFRKIS